MSDTLDLDPLDFARRFMPAPPVAAVEDHHARLERWVGMRNIADDPEVGDQLERLASRVKADFEIDDTSRGDWKTKYRQWLDFAMQIAQEKTYPWPHASNVIYPLITTAAIMFAARAYPAIIRDRNVVKGVVIGDDSGVPASTAPSIPGNPGAPIPAMGMPDLPGLPSPPAANGLAASNPPNQPPGPVAGPGMPPPGMVAPGMGQPQWLVPPGAKQARADRIGRHMSWQLLDEQEEWEPQMDQLLIAIPIVGCYFKKTYRSPALGRNVSETVDALSLCVNYHARSFETAPRHTELVRMYPWDIEEWIRSGLFIDYGDGYHDYGHDTMSHDGDDTGSQQNDDDAPTTFLEQHRRWDLDGDGYAEPYIVTVARDSGKLARIQAGFEMDDVRWTDDGQVRKVDRVEIYTKFGFIPNPESKVYDIGFGHLLYPINDAVNTTLNQMFDAGHLQNVGGGFIGSGLSINTGAIRFQMGEYKPVNTVGGNIRDNVFPIPFNGPNPVLMNLLQFLVEAGERIAAVRDVMVGDMPGDNTSGITTLAVIEQGLKVFSAIYKRIHRSLGYEFRKLYRLNRLYGPTAGTFSVGGQQFGISRQDYEEGAGVEPVSDPQMVTDMQRLGRAQFLLTFKDDPRVNGGKVLLDAFRAAMIPNPETYMTNAAPPPDPRVLLKNRELDIREKHEMVDAMIKSEHGKALIVKDIALAELALAQARKLDNDAQLGWVEQHIEALKAKLDGIATLSDIANGSEQSTQTGTA